jgi:cysteine desulfurase / selenocysteine lyase
MPTPPLDPARFDLDPSRLWVMHCAEGPVPKPAAEALLEFLFRETRPWTVRWVEDFRGLPERVRRETGRLLGGSPADVTLTSTTTGGLALVAQGFPWRDGDEVLTPLGEFPANAWPWLALAPRGVRLREVPLWGGHAAGADAWRSTPPPVDADPESRLLDAVTPQTRLMAVSWVRFQDGLRLDLERLAAGCRERGVPLVVDGIQGAGTLPLSLDDLPGVVAFATGGHKGLLAPQGLGVLWTEEGFRHELAPPGGWLSVEDARDFDRPSTDLERDFSPDGERLEMGVPNLLGCAALGESLAMLNDAGPETIARHVQGLQTELLDRLEESGARWLGDGEGERLRGLLEQDRLGSILSFHHRGSGLQAMNRALKSGQERGIYASVREGYLRIALHGWHHRGDLGRLVAWLRES